MSVLEVEVDPCCRRSDGLLGAEAKRKYLGTYLTSLLQHFFFVFRLRTTNPQDDYSYTQTAAAAVYQTVEMLQFKPNCCGPGSQTPWSYWRRPNGIYKETNLPAEFCF